MSSCERCPLNASIKAVEKRVAGFEVAALEQEAAAETKKNTEALRAFYDDLAEELDCDEPLYHTETGQPMCPLSGAIDNALRFCSVNGRVLDRDGYVTPKVLRDKLPKPPQAHPSQPGWGHDGNGQYL